MKGKIETTIPQRQYENIKTTYEFTTEAERTIAKESAIADCIELHSIVGRKVAELQKKEVNATANTASADIALKIKARKTIDGVDWRLREKNGRQYWEEYVDGKWIVASEVSQS